MLTEEEVAAKWNDRREMVKKYYSPSENGFKWTWKRGVKPEEACSWDYDVPEFWPGYNDSCRERTRIRPHVEHGYYPEDLFRKRAPNETEQEKEYGKCNFKQTTLVHCSDFLNTVGRALDEKNYTIEFEDKEGDYWRYVTEGLQEFGSVNSYVKNIVPKTKTLDAMGLVVILPKEIATIQQIPEGEEEEQEVIDPNVPLEPVPIYVPVYDVWGFEYDKWYLFKTNEKSWVDSYKREKTGFVFMLVDDENAWRIEQTGKKGEFTFDITLWFVHGTGEAPAIHLGGEPLVKDGFVRAQSPYLTAVEHFDMVLLDEDYLRKSKAKCAFPHPVMIGDDCEFVDPVTKVSCYDGKIIWMDLEGVEQTKECPNCHGTGSKSRMGPLGDLKLRPPDRNQPDAQRITAHDALAFISPDPQIMEYLRTEIQEETEQGRSIMHLKSEQPIVGGEHETATQVGVGVKAQQAFIKPIADQTLDVMEFIYSMIGKMRQGKEFEPPVITRPSNYDIRTDDELTEEFRLNAPLMPPVVVDQMGWDILVAQFGHSPETMRVYTVVCAADELLWTDKATIQSMFQQALIEPWEVTLHAKAMAFYGELGRQGKLTGDVEKDKTALIALAKARAPKVERPLAEKLAMSIAK